MGRTADSYLKEAGATPLNTLFNFAELTDERLDKELAEAWDEQMSVNHGEERKTQIGRRIAHIMFEMNCRIKETP